MFCYQNRYQSFEKNDFCHLRIQPFLISLIKFIVKTPLPPISWTRRKQWIYLVSSRADSVIIKTSCLKKQKRKKGKKTETTNYKRITRLAD